MKLLFLRLVVGSLISLFACTVVLACKCVPQSESTTEALQKYDGVWSGKVMSIKGPKVVRQGKRVVSVDEFVEVTFRVAQSWKGVDSEVVTILTPMSDCAYRFKIGEEYLVWAYLNREAPTKLVTDFCCRTDKFIDSAKDVKELGDGNQSFVKSAAAKHKALQLTAR